MLRSMYAGVSGLKAHQIRMDVIGNNIANVNTVAFKSSRVTFQDILSQTLRHATGPTPGGLAGTNPVQVGIGTMVASIDNLMTQGSLEYTGRLTDLAIEGDGFFMITPDDGRKVFYTRDGNFALSANKELVDSGNGYKVLGWNVGNNPTVSDINFIDTTLKPTPIVLPIGTKKKAKATDMIEFASNINSMSAVRQPNFAFMEVVAPGGDTVQRLKFTWHEITDKNAAGFDPGDHRFEWLVEVVAGGGKVVKGETGYITLQDDGTIRNINGKTAAQVSPSDSTILIKDPSGNQVRLFVAPSILGGNFVPWGTLGSTAPNYNRFDALGNDINRFDELVVVAPDDIAAGASGLPMDGQFTLGDETELKIGTRWQITPQGASTPITLRIAWAKGSNGNNDIARTTNPFDPIHQTDSSYWQYEIDILDTGGGIIFIDDPNIAGDERLPGTATSLANKRVRGTLIFGDKGDVIGGEGAGVTFTLTDGTYSAGIVAPRIGSTRENLYFSTNSTTASTTNLIGEFVPGEVYRTSIQVYDSLGQPHNLTFTFTKAGMNEWDWRADLPLEDNGAASLTGRYGNLIWPTTGQKPILKYDPVFNPTTGLYDRTPYSLDFKAAGADQISIKLNFDLATQFEGDSNLRAINQNGFPMGVLRTFNIETNGLVTGIYDSGLRSPEAQIALCIFRNPEGLFKNGDNTYLQTANSGIPLIGIAGRDGYGQIYSGTLEMSNVDLAQEFTNMIITQRGFQANTRIITTADEMLVELMGIKR